jgi:hypothetical protein
MGSASSPTMLLDGPTIRTRPAAHHRSLPMAAIRRDSEHLQRYKVFHAT